jgi:hypothetical protein
MRQRHRTMSETDYKTHAIALIVSELQTFGVFGFI